MNSSIPPEIQLEVFKKLDPGQTVKLRQVCGEWLHLINQEQSLWRRVTIPERKTDSVKSVIDLFNEKSDGTIEEVIILSYLWKSQISSLAEALERSKSTLTTLSFRAATRSPEGVLSHLVSIGFKNLVDYRDCPPSSPQVVEVMRRSRAGEEQVPFPKSLQVLWTEDASVTISAKDLGIFTSPLLSLKFQSFQSSLKTDLQECSKTLKHLSLTFAAFDSQDSPSSVHFPNLQVLELGYEISFFPSWMEVPSNLKLFACRIVWDLPPISELCVESFQGFEGLESDRPELEVLRFNGMHARESNQLKPSEQERLLELMKARMKTVEDGVEWEGIKMKKLKKLVIPLRNLELEFIRTLGGLTEELIDISELNYPIIELEV